MNHYHTVHEQVCLSEDEKATAELEDGAGITKLREQLITPNASGLVLETCIGANRNKPFYTKKVQKVIGIDWVEAAILIATKKLEDPKEMTLARGDVHKLPFADGSFDTIVDTFGLECSYDLDKAWKEMKRLVKPGGKILLLERGQSLWMS